MFNLLKWKKDNMEYTWQRELLCDALIHCFEKVKLLKSWNLEPLKYKSIATLIPRPEQKKQKNTRKLVEHIVPGYGAQQWSKMKNIKEPRPVFSWLIVLRTTKLFFLKALRKLSVYLLQIIFILHTTTKYLI